MPAAVKIESLPTRSSGEQSLQNILSISTAGRNRYLLHFNSHHSLIQWTAGIRLAMYEHATLQEAYTGALIAGRGKTLNNINVIMERSRLKTEEWVRVRFGAGVPWRRCWCVISPPDEKEFAKLQKEMKKRSPYDRSPVPILKGDIKFYDSRKDGKKQKKARPIATITDAYSAYAIYPQAKSLVNASTLLKIEGSITVHSNPPSSTEGFIFVMPETHPMVSGFEMLLRFLFPTWDTFGLYGRPGRLVASILDNRSLMFAMPKHKRYGYLDILDVSTLILDEGASSWKERDWRKKLKEATGNRMNAIEDGTRSPHSRTGSRSSNRLSFGNSGPGGKPKVGFTDDQGSVRSSCSFSLNGGGPRNNEVLPPGGPALPPAMAAAAAAHHHMRNSSDPNLRGAAASPPRSDYGAPVPAASHAPPQAQQMAMRAGPPDRMAYGEQTSSDDEPSNSPTPEVHGLEGMRNMQTPEPVSRPPAFNHGPQARPTSKAYHSPELRRANSRLSSTTLAQLANSGAMADAGHVPPRRDGDGVLSGPSVQPHANPVEMPADDRRPGEALSPPGQDGPPGRRALPPLTIPTQRSRSPMPQGPPSLYPVDANSPTRPHTSDGRGPPPPRSPHQQQPGLAPDHQMRPGQQPGLVPDHQMRPGPGGPGQQQPNFIPGPGPGGPMPPQGRGRPPPHQRPGPPGNGPHPFRHAHGTFGPGPGPRPYPGPQGMGGPPFAQNQPQRKPLPAGTHQSLTPNDIIEHYVSDVFRGPPTESPPPPQQRRPGPPPPHHQQGPGYGGPANYHGGDGGGRHAADRPRAGVMKTVGGGGPPMRKGSDFDLPEVNFGPTINYGAAQVARKPVGGHGEPGFHDRARRPYTPEQAPGQESPGRQPRHARQDSEETARRTVAWQPGGSYAGSGNQGLTPEQYVQHRASPPLLNAMGGGGASMGARTMSPQPALYAAGRGGGPAGPQYGGPMSPPGGGFPRARQASALSPPPQGQYGPGPGAAQNRNIAPQYQGQAF